VINDAGPQTPEPPFGTDVDSMPIMTVAVQI